jgi:hypothetical protein
MVQSKQRKVWAKKLAGREQQKRLDQQVADLRAATKQQKEVRQGAGLSLVRRCSVDSVTMLLSIRGATLLCDYARLY